MAQLRLVLGVFLGMGCTAAVGRLLPGGGPTLIAAMGASAVLLFGAPTSAFARPWPALGGNVLSAFVGVTCARVIPDPTLAAVVAVTVAVGVMSALRCLHPPGGAVALLAVLGGDDVRAAGYHFVFVPVGLNSLVMLGVALAYHRLLRAASPRPTTG